MAATDSISDFLTRIRNAQMAGHRVVEIPASKTRENLTRILKEQGYIYKYKIDEDASPQGVIKIALQYDKDGNGAIQKMGSISTPGLRKYAKATEMPRIINGLGIAIVSTSKGLMTGKQAQQQNIGGELLCYVY